MSIKEHLGGNKGFDDRIMLLRKTRYEWERDIDASKVALIKSVVFEILEELVVLIPDSVIGANYNNNDSSAIVNFSWGECEMSERLKTWINLSIKADVDSFLTIKSFQTFVNTGTRPRIDDICFFEEKLDEDVWSNKDNFERIVSLALLKSGLSVEYISTKNK